MTRLRGSKGSGGPISELVPTEKRTTLPARPARSGQGSKPVATREHMVNER
jgi:hypothetical protein